MSKDARNFVAIKKEEPKVAGRENNDAFFLKGLWVYILT